MTIGPVPEAPTAGTAEVKGNKISIHRNPHSADGARLDHGTLARREYSLLAPEETESDLAAAEPWDRRDVPNANIGIGCPDERAVERGDQNGQRALLACVQPEDADVERGTPNGSTRLTRASIKRVKGGDPSPSSARFSRAARGGKGDTPTRQNSPPARSLQ